MADGDGRYLLNLAEEVAALKTVKPLDSAALVAAVQKRAPLYDKAREEHYNLISALHKSIRGSDPDAALYWLARMLAGGEHPLYIARRLVRAAVEDIGLADPQAVVQALAAKDVFDFLGSPEGEIALAQMRDLSRHRAQIERGLCGAGAARRAAQEHGSLMPPAHILNAPTKLMKNWATAKATNTTTRRRTPFPARTISRTVWSARLLPAEGHGFEREIAKRLEYWSKLRAKKRQTSDVAQSFFLDRDLCDLRCVPD